MSLLIVSGISLLSAVGFVGGGDAVVVVVVVVVVLVVEVVVVVVGLVVITFEVVEVTGFVGLKNI